MTGPKSFDVTDAAYFDGDTPVSRALTRLTLEEGDLCLTLVDGTHIRWPAGDVRRVSDLAGKGHASLRWTGDPLARLYTPNPFIANDLPAVDRRAPPEGRGRLAMWALAAVAAVVLQIFVLIPLMANQLASFIPPAGEKALGEATLSQIQEILDDTGVGQIPVCEAEDGVAALKSMEVKLSEASGLTDEFTVLVLDHKMVNAFALPGGFIVFFRGLIEEADKPEEVAAVFAHEMGHVVSRDPTRHALRSAGSIGVLGLLFGDFAGGAAVLLLAEQLINAHYSQGAETAADVFATDVLLAAGVSPAALGDFFERLRKKHGDS